MRGFLVLKACSQTCIFLVLKALKRTSALSMEFYSSRKRTKTSHTEEKLRAGQEHAQQTHPPNTYVSFLKRLNQQCFFLYNFDSGKRTKMSLTKRKLRAHRTNKQTNKQTRVHVFLALKACCQTCIFFSLLKR